MANLETIVQHLDHLRTQVGTLRHNQDLQGAAQQENRQRLQAVIEERTPQPEAGSLRPSSFRGQVNEDANRWLKRFLSYAEYCNMNNQKKVRIFRLMLEGAAEVWYNGLPNAIRGNWDQLENAFTEKYIDANHLNWLKEQGLFARVQAPGENVESYVTDVRQRCNQLQKGDAETRSIIIRGLLPAIKAFAIGQQPETLDDLETKANLAESIEDIKPRSLPVDKVNMIQETYDKGIGELTAALNRMRDEVRQQARDMQYLRNNLRFQTPSRRFSDPSFNTRGNYQPYCQRCNKAGHNPGNCTRRPQPGDLTCYFCNRRGHLKRNCPELGKTRIGLQLRQNFSSSNNRPSLNYTRATQSGAGTRPRQI